MAGTAAAAAEAAQVSEVAWVLAAADNPSRFTPLPAQHTPAKSDDMPMGERARERLRLWVTYPSDPWRELSLNSLRKGGACHRTTTTLPCLWVKE